MDRAFRHTVFAGERIQAHVGLLGPYGWDVALVKFGSVMTRARGTSAFGSALLDLIRGVIRWRAKKQVRRINARWRIAGVADVLAVSDRAVMNSPREPVGSHQWASSSHVENAVTAERRGSGPHPASGGSSDVLPEALLWGLGGCRHTPILTGVIGA